MTNQQTVAVLGAGGDAGRAITTALRERGHRVLAVTRAGHSDGPAADNRAADLEIRDATIAATDGADVIVNAAQPGYAQWATRLPTMVENAIAAAAAHDARLVSVDNLYMFAPSDGPISEASPAHATDPKGALRARLQARILDAHASGDISAVVGMQSDYFGPGARNSALWMLAIRNGLAGKRMMALFDADQPHTFAYLPDTARAFVELVENPAGDGRAWVLPAAPALTQRDILALINNNLDESVKTGVFSPWMVAMAGLVNRDVRESLSTRPQFERPWVTNSREYARTYGDLDLTDTADAIAATVAAERKTAARQGLAHP